MLCMTFAGAAFAEYPEKPIALVVPYSAGGSTETMARVLGKASLRVRQVVECPNY